MICSISTAKQLMNRYILTRIGKNCRGWKGHCRLGKGNQERKHQTELMQIKHSEKWKVLTISDSKEQNSKAMATTKQNKTAQRIWKSPSPQAKADHLLSKRSTYFFSFPLEACYYFFFCKSAQKIHVLLLQAHLDSAFSSTWDQACSD